MADAAIGVAGSEFRCGGSPDFRIADEHGAAEMIR
jgi:hypothetical protein